MIKINSLNFKNLKKITKKIDFTKIMLAFIILTGLWLRLKNIDNMVWEQSGYDEHRDMLVAEHILNNKEHVIRGPLAAGGFNWLKTSPIYFYLVTALWSVTRTPPLFLKLWAVLLGLMPLLAYKISTSLKNKKLGLITAALFAFNGELIYESRQLLQPFLLPVFSLLFVWMLIKFKIKKHYSYLSWAIAFLLLPLHFHYGIFLTLPIGLFLIIYYWAELISEDFSWKNVLLPGFTMIVFGLLWIFLTYRTHLFDQFFFFVLNFSDHNKDFLTQTNNILQATITMIWRGQNSNKTLLITMFLTFIAFIKTKNNKKNWFKTSPVFLLSLSVLFMTISNGFVADTYLLALLPFFLIILAIGIYELFSINHLLGFLFLCIVLFQQYLYSLKEVTYYIPKESFYEQNFKISQVIFTDYFSSNKVNKEPNFALALLTTSGTLPFDGWGTSGFWFNLEKLTNKKLVKNTDYGVNSKPLVKNADIIYLICDHRTKKKLVKTECLDRFIDARDYLDPNYQKIFSSDTYTVWKFKIDGDKEKPRSSHLYNHVYKELMN